MSISYNSNITTNGLVLCLDAGNPRSYPGSGTSWKDVSGTGNNGTLVNGVGYNSANLGSLLFDGVDDLVTISGSQTLSEATFIVWLKRTGTQVSFASIFFSRGGTGGSTTGLNYYGTSNTLGYHWNDTAATYDFNSGLTVPDNTWCMCALTVNSTTAMFYLGTSTGITTATNTTTHGSTTLANLVIGADPTIVTRDMSGSLSLAMLYNRALTEAEIQQNYNAARGRYGI